MPAIAVFTRVPGADNVSGTIREKFYDLSFVSDGVNANYTVGGLTINPDDLGLLQVIGMEPIGGALAAGTAQTDIFLLNYDHVRKVIQLFGDAVAATGLNELGAVAINTLVYRVRVVGFQ